MNLRISYSTKNQRPTAINGCFQVISSTESNGQVSSLVRLLGTTGPDKNLTLGEDWIALISVRRGACKIDIATHAEHDAKMRLAN